MANRVRDVRRFLSDGANAIETDVTFSPEGAPVANYHGFPCDCWRFCFWSEAFGDYLRFVRHLVTAGDAERFPNELALLYLDLKTSNVEARFVERAGQMLSDAIVENVIGAGVKKASMPWVVLGVSDASHVTLFKQFRSALADRGYDDYLDKFGYDVYSSSSDGRDVDAKLAAMELHNVSRIWLGDGITNCLWAWRPFSTRLIDLRNRRRVDGAYYWTVDRLEEFRRILA